MSTPSSSGPSDSKDTATTATPPKREPFFDTVRRFSDLQFSTLLHSLIGLPSSLSPPSTSGWIIDDDLADSERPPPRPHRSGSDSIIDEVHKLRDNNNNDDDGKNGGIGSFHRSTSSTGSGGESNAGKREIVGPGELFGFPTSPLDMFRAFEEAHGANFRSLLSEANNPAPPSSSSTTELDYYSFFERQFRQQSPPRHDDPSQPRRLVKSYSEVRSVTGPDGVTKTRRVEVKKYADGSEERREKDGVVLPDTTSGNPRITEI
ncbi:hypothetical protein BDD12DRAFT_828964 [Trichophaea hybrida]|nr:hypothetical protein BDD12DRAFT_828964 [Trichophaea hybrida]